MIKKEKLIRIGQLVKMAGVSAPTIKHYIREGLLPPPVKTSRNMAYYDQSCVARIQQIKKIQKEKFLPLDMIKRLLDAGAARDEELELGEAIFKTHKIVSNEAAVGERQVEKRLGYPMDKIRILEGEGLVLPQRKNGEKVYDEIDCKIVEMMKDREALGVPFDFSVETLRIYKDAISKAVSGDIRHFIRNTTDDRVTRGVIDSMTKVDETLDTFMVLYRYKMLRTMSHTAIQEVDRLPGHLPLLNIFPVSSRELPPARPEDPFLRAFYFLCRGDFSLLSKMAGKGMRDQIHPDIVTLSILADLLDGQLGKAMERAADHIPKPSARTLDNIVAAMVYLYNISGASGISVPLFHTKKVLSYLKRTEMIEENNRLLLLFSRYICGAIYVILPEVIETREVGMRVLTELDAFLGRRKLSLDHVPVWFSRTVHFEILPELEARINRLLAFGYLESHRPEKAAACLERVIDVADVDSPHAAWARMKRLQVPKPPSPDTDARFR